MKQKELNRDEIITKPELEVLIESLVIDADYHPYAIYGLMFLFGSIKKALEAGYKSDIENICVSALLKLYSISDNGYEAIERVTKNIHVYYRAVDFKNKSQRDISDVFVKSECGGTVKDAPPQVLDLSDQPAECQQLNSLANQLSEVMKHPNLPIMIYNLLSDEFAQVKDTTDTPENILLNLESLIRQQSGGGVR